MAQKVLNYDKNVVRQETGWWCGPASVQVVLNGRGIVKAERELMLRLERYEGNVNGRGEPWDDGDGTDHIGQVSRVLNDYAPAAKYKTVEYPKDPPTAALKDQLWNHLKASIDAGYGMVANIVSPPSNRWKITAPSTIAPNYGTGTIWHYVAIMGYSDEGGRKVWVADPGFSPFGFWATLDSLASLIPPKGYSYSTAAAGTKDPEPAPNVPAPVGIPKFTEVQDFGQASSPRTKSPTNFFLHTEEPNGTTKPEEDARRLANWAKRSTSSGSYHFILRAGKLIQVVPVSRASWSVLDANAYSINLCFAGSRASWSEKQWMDNCRDDIRIAAYIAVRECRKAGISVQVLAPPYKRGNGISDHKYVTQILGIGTHTDVGYNFPWKFFVQCVLEFVNPSTSVPNLIDAEAARAAAWIGKRITKGETPIMRDGKKIGAFAEFEHAHIYWRNGAQYAFAVPHADPEMPGTGLFETYGSDFKWEQGPLGFPTAAHVVVTNGASQQFEDGVLFRKNGTPRGFRVNGKILETYKRLRFEQGALGWPISNEYKVPDTDNVRQDFEHGSLIWSPTGVAVTFAAALTAT